MSEPSVMEWFLVCKLSEDAVILVIKRETEAINYMKDNDDGSLFILEVLA